MQGYTVNPLYSVQAEVLFSRPDVQPVEALEVVYELREAASAIAASDISQLPRDINTASNIITHTVDLLLRSTGNSSAVNLTEVTVNEVRIYLSSSILLTVF